MEDLLNFLLQPLLSFVNYAMLDDGSSLVADLKQLIDETVGRTSYILVAIFSCLLFLNALLLATVVCFYQEFQKNCNEAFALFHDKFGKRPEPLTSAHQPKLMRHHAKSDTEVR
ncbi:uncharacterized protein [Bemisia tabaci]|uniref:uncharacterized protein n=1 Tax=Bemisia tabaci TaxID=7038 RepID=UPI0008F9969E|nr:PREDICTED: uncharacterized protein LOC109044152 [Bemisia tabaci]